MNGNNKIVESQQGKQEVSTSNNGDRKSDETHLFIWRPHDMKYQTHKWYTGSGEISQEIGKQTFEIKATFQLTAKIQVEDNVLSKENTLLADQYRDLKRCCAVIDQLVYDIYGKQFHDYFAHHKIPFEVLSVRAWESDKVPETVHKILAFLGKEGCDISRNEPVLIVGGGVLSDVGGLACSLQHRRSPYIMIGTSVVAAIDAGPSPRTCCNGKNFKNSIGAYHPPVLTIVDRTLFKSLHKGHIRNGMAEIIKMAITDDLSLFELCEKYGLEIINTHFANDFSMNGYLENTNEKNTLESNAKDIIYKALYSYMKHEGTNMFETFQDRPHAYGHTWSPRFEPSAKLMHGHAVAIGMAFGATLSKKLGWVTEDERDRIVNLLRKLELAVYHPILEDFELMISGQKNMRRKRGDSGLWAPLPRGIGNVDYLQEVSPELLKETVLEHKAYCEKFENKGAGKEMYLKDLGLD